MAKKRKTAAAAPGKRKGQVASEKARFDLGPDARVIGDALGTPPPGYGLTMVRGFVRDAHTVVVVWDVNDDAAVAAGSEKGWSALTLHVTDGEGEVLARAPVGERSGVYHLRVEAAGKTVIALIGFARADGSLAPVARSAPLRVPPDPSFRAEPGEAWVRVPPDTDLRRIVTTERPPRPGHDERRHPSSASRRLTARLRLAGKLARRAAAAEDSEADAPQDGSPGSEPPGDEPTACRADKPGLSESRRRAAPRGTGAPEARTAEEAPPQGPPPPRLHTGRANAEAPRERRVSRPAPPPRTSAPPRQNGDDKRSGRGRR